MFDIRTSPVAQRLIKESKALRTATAQLDDTREQVQDVLSQHTTSDPPSTLIQWAMKSLLQTLEVEDIRVLKTRSASADDIYFQKVATAWALWAVGERPQAEKLVREAQDEAQPRSGALLHLMALQYWGQAVIALTRGEEEEAKRLYRRALDMGAQHGTPTNMALQWSYAASFFRHSVK